MKFIATVGLGAFYYLLGVLVASAGQGKYPMIEIAWWVVVGCCWLGATIAIWKEL